MQSFMRRRWRSRALALLSPLALILSACGIWSSPSGVLLDVDFRQQLPDSWDYCGPANVLMWRLYNGYSEVSQHQIYNSMGIGGQGTSPEKLAEAAWSWANVLQATFERVSCDGGAFDQREIIAARQITSIDNDTPMIVIVDGGFHAVLAIGGDWHHDSSSGLDVWDVTYVHDPRLTHGEVHYGAGSWIDWYAAGFTCEQVFDEGAVGNTGYNLETYGDNVVVYGYDGPGPGGDPIPK